MKPKIWIFVFVISSAILGSLAFVHARKAKAAATYSTAASLYAALMNQNTFDEFRDDWRILTDSEYDQLIREMFRGHSIDAGRRGQTSDGVLVDSWANRLQIAVRKKGQEKSEYIIWSKGSDGLSKTSDDIVIPDGARLP